MAVGYHAVNKANLSDDTPAIVLGTGPVGLAVITALRARGHGPIIASDMSVGRRRYAEQQGAHVVVNPNDESPFRLSEVRGKTPVVFECVGVPGMLGKDNRKIVSGSPPSLRQPNVISFSSARTFITVTTSPNSWWGEQGVRSSSILPAACESAIWYTPAKVASIS